MCAEASPPFDRPARTLVIFAPSGRRPVLLKNVAVIAVGHFNTGQQLAFALPDLRAMAGIHELYSVLIFPISPRSGDAPAGTVASNANNSAQERSMSDTENTRLSRRTVA
ncbi:MAG TPA: hypothetical protein VMI47_04600, partial [Pseudolabrys sp.]|nr:hypothetical protein [Pseudolabrys sp.]